MNSKKLRNKKGRIIVPLSMLMLIWISACASTGKVITPPAKDDPPTVVLPTLTAIPTNTVAPTPEPTSVAVDNQVYPYFLPLVTKLENVSQTINGVTTQIDWAYVDESRVALHFTISGLNWPDGSTLESVSQIQAHVPILANFQFGGFSGAEGAMAEPARQGVITGFSDQALLSGIWNADQYPNVDLGIDLPVVGPTAAGKFHFNFTVPVTQGSKKLENIDQTVAANNVSMTLKSLTLNPSHAEALICFQMPSTVDWGFSATQLVINGRGYPVSGFGLATGKTDPASALTSPERCNSVGFEVAYDHKLNAAVTLTVPYLQASIPDVITSEIIDRANHRLADQGIQFEYTQDGQGSHINMLKRPEGATDLDIYPLIWNAMADQYDGPWVFTVDVPK